MYNLSQLGFGVLTLAAFAAILTGIPNGLLGNPDMSVSGFQSSGQSLSWFADQTRDSTPSATVLSLPDVELQGADSGVGALADLRLDPVAAVGVAELRQRWPVAKARKEGARR